MDIYDILILVLLVVATVWGARRGLAKQLATLASLIVGYIVAVNFRQPVAQLIDAPPPWNMFTAMLGLFTVTSLLIWIAFRFVNGTIEKAGLARFDTQMGGLFGLAKGIIIAMAVTMFVVVVAGEAQRTAVLSSLSGYNICRLLNQAHSIVPSEWQQVIQPYFETIEKHQQIVDQPLPGGYPDPFEMASPSDAGVVDGLSSPYDDPSFGSYHPGTTHSATNGPIQSRYDDNSGMQRSGTQATLLEPIFDR